MGRRAQTSDTGSVLGFFLMETEQAPAPSGCQQTGVAVTGLPGIQRAELCPSRLCVFVPRAVSHIRHTLMVPWPSGGQFLTLTPAGKAGTSPF